MITAYRHAWRSLWRSVFPGASVFLLACGGGAAAARSDSAGALPAVDVSTAVVVRTNIALDITATGTVVARAGSVATLSAPAPTRVTRILVSSGERVRAGQPLVVLDRTPFEAASQQADAAARAAREAEARASGLVTQGIWPRRELEQARAARAQAEAAVTLARRGLALSTLRAPMAGVVSRVQAAMGASVDAAQPLVDVVDPAAIEVRLALTPGDAARVPPGAMVSFTADGGTSGATPTLGSGRVTTIAPGVDSLTGAVDVRVRLIAPTRQPRVGEVLSAHIQVDVSTDAIAVPIASLVPLGDGYQVFVVSRDTARARPVTVGRRAGPLAEALTGVAPGDVVVTEGAYGVEDGSALHLRTRPDASSSPAARNSARLPTTVRP
jgi:RND family efflux transporter MFP subunit